MKESLISKLITQQDYQDVLFVAYICLGALALRHAAMAREIFRSKIILYLATGFGTLAIAIYVMTLVSYLRYPNYVDHIEVTVASVSWLGVHGHALYPNWVTDDVYGIGYGPILFLLHGLFLLVDPTITISKALGVASLLIAFGLIFVVIKQTVSNNLTAIFVIGSLVMLFAPFGPFAYWTRAEPFLILISTLSLLVAINLRSFAAVAIIGALAGVAAGFKIPGFIYVAPLAMMTLARVETSHGRFILAIIGVACAAIFALLPFCLKESSLVSYSQYVHLAADHGLSTDAFKANLLFALVLFAPIVGIWFWRKPGINYETFWLLVGLCISTAIAVVVGSVSGPYHLLPFAPLCLYAVILVTGVAEANQIIAILFLVLLLAYGPGGYILNSRLMEYWSRNSETEREKIVELQTYLDKYPGAEIGFSDNKHDPDTNYRIFSVLNGHTLRVDFSAWAEMAVGVNEKNIIRFIRGCEVPTWILPLGPAFAKLSWYTERPMLSDDFRRIFSVNYELTQTGKFYQVWECRKQKAELSR